MKEITGNLWTYLASWVAITTNGVVKRDGSAVMGRGVALQAARRFPCLPYELGARIRQHGNRVFVFPHYRLYTLPVKHRYWEEADLDLIASSCRQLAAMVPPDQTVYLVRPGCGAGRLAWQDVRPVIAPILDDRFFIVYLPRQ